MDASSSALDLLHPAASFRIQRELVDTAIVFAFAGSPTGGLFQDALAQAQVAPSDFRAELFADDLFLRDFVKTAFSVRVRGKPAPLGITHILRTLVNPPRDPAVRQFRQEVMAELLASKALRAGLQELYDKVARIRDLLEGASSVDSYDVSRRQLEILACFRDVILICAERFGAATSGLRRLSEFGLRVRAGEPFHSLVDLLRYDDQMAAVQLQVALGADGRIRKLEVRHVQEDTQNAFTQSPWRRWVSKLELLLRGYRFSDGEVMARLLDAVFEGVRDEVVVLVQLAGDLEFWLGALGFAERAEAAGLPITLPTWVPRGAPVVLDQLWNPHLLGAGIRPVPASLSFDRQDTIALLTGPNSGGKTRLLQSVALCQLLAQGGLFVPAARAVLAEVPGLVVSLIQETKADQTEGRLGMELMRIRELFERLPPGAMVILDELCSGTNPSEGEEIFQLVLDMLHLLSPQALITTHFLAFARRLAEEQKGSLLRFLQVQLGPNQEPTYQFAPGVAQTSLAGRAAERLGVTADQLLRLIEQKAVQARGGGRPV